MAQQEDPNGIERYRGILAGKIKESPRCKTPGCNGYASPSWADYCNECGIKMQDKYRGPEREMWLVVTQCFLDTAEREWKFLTSYVPAFSYDNAWQRAYAEIRQKWDVDNFASIRAVVVERMPIHGDWHMDGTDFHMVLRLDRDVIYEDEVTE